MRNVPAFALVALVIGTVLRAITLPLPGTSDVEAFKAWSYHATTVGVTHAYGNERPMRRHTFTFGDREASANYPPLTLDALAIIGHLYQRAMGGQFPNTRALTIAIKSVICAMDVVLLAIVWRAVRRMGGSQAAWWAAAAYWINPAAILTSALGYIDVWFAVPAVASLVAASFGRPLVAGALFAGAVLTKQQAIFLAPVVIVALWNAGDPRDARARLSSALATATLVIVLVVAPIVLAGTMPNMLRAVGSVAFQTMLSGNACNLWWIVGYGFQIADAAREGVPLSAALTMPVNIVLIPQLPVVGPLNARVIAIVLTGAAWAWGLWIGRHTRDLGLHAAVAAFLVHAYFTLSTQVHENHFFLAVPLLAIAASLGREYVPVLTTLSIIFALNLYLFYGVTGEPPSPAMRTLTAIDSTVLVAIANCAALVWHARVLARTASARE